MNQSGNVGFVDPHGVTNQLVIEPGSTIADFGCGAGYFSCAFAEKAGQNGHVLALDILPASLEAVMSRARTLGLTNITAQRVNLEKEGGSGLDPQSCDWVIIKDMLFQNAKKDTIIYEAARVLKAGGKLFLMEWSKENTFVGPEKDLRLTSEEVQSLLNAAGLATLRELEVGGYHFAYLAEKQA
jgi:ubiquinone/menaquinone biosynthesis C-methylase UbiE